jgi:hypothetical protein
VKTKFKAILRRLILWAAGEAIYAAEKRCVIAAEHHSLNLTTQLHQSRDHLAKENAKQWRMLDAKIAALQAIDAPCGRDVGKLVIIARVGGQDIVKIIDIVPDISQRNFKDMVEEIKARFGARPEFLDTTHAERIHLAQVLGMPDSVSRAAARDRGGLCGGF